MNLLPLESFRKFFQLHPFHFWGAAGSQVPTKSGCNDIVKEYAWQYADGVGRHEIRSGIEVAERKIAQFIGYSIAPHYVIEVLPFPRYRDIQVNRLGYAGADGRWITLQLKEGNLIAVGTRGLTKIGDLTLTLSDTDGDGVKDTFTGSILNVTITDATEAVAYFSSTERFDGSAIGDRWEVSPISSTLSGTTLTITGRAWQVIKPVLYEGFAEEEIDASSATNYATKLEIYRQYTTGGTGDIDEAQAVLIWESLPYPNFAYPYPPTAVRDPASSACLLARCNIRDAKNGVVALGESYYNSTEGAWTAMPMNYWNRPPDRVEVRYRAGLQLQDGEVAEPLKAIVCRMAASEIARPICACEGANRELYRWQFDLSRSSGSNDEGYAFVSKEDLNSPFGTCRGQVHAWKQVKAYRIIRGFSV